MTFFALILYVLLVVGLTVSVFFLIGTILMGLFVFFIGNIARKSRFGRFAPVWWDLVTVGITILSTALIWKDIFNDSVDYAFIPFIIMFIHGICSLVFLALCPPIKKNDDENFFNYPEDEYDDSNIYTIISPQEVSSYVPENNSLYNNLATRLSRVRSNLEVDNTVFQECGITFKGNLVEEYGRLQLNVELFNTKGFVQKYGKFPDFVVKVNVYDQYKNLLCVEDIWFEYSLLKQGYASDYIYFMNDNMDKADSMRVYAVVFGDDNDDEDDFE